MLLHNFNTAHIEYNPEQKHNLFVNPTTKSITIKTQFLWLNWTQIKANALNSLLKVNSSQNYQSSISSFFETFFWKWYIIMEDAFSDWKIMQREQKNSQSYNVKLRRLKSFFGVSTSIFSLLCDMVDKTRAMNNFRSIHFLWSLFFEIVYNWICLSFNFFQFIRRPTGNGCGQWWMILVIFRVYEYQITFCNLLQRFSNTNTIFVWQIKLRNRLLAN